MDAQLDSYPRILDFRGELDRRSEKDAVMRLTLDVLRDSLKWADVRGGALYLAGATADTEAENEWHLFDQERDSHLSAHEEWTRKCLNKSGPSWKPAPKSKENLRLLCIPLVDVNALHVGVMLLEVAMGETHKDERVAFLSTLGAQVAAALGRAERLRAYHEAIRTTADAMDVDRLLDVMLQDLATLGFDYAIMSIADGVRGDIAAVKAQNVPPAWVKASFHQLDDPDIVPFTFRSPDPFVGPLDGWDERFDPEIFDRFEHHRLKRCFARIEASGEAIGVAEFGCFRDNQEAVPLISEARVDPFSRNNIEEALRVLSARAKPQLLLARPNRLLRNLARSAAQAVGAASAAIQVLERSAPEDITPKQLRYRAGVGPRSHYLEEFEATADAPDQTKLSLGLEPPLFGTLRLLFPTNGLTPTPAQEQTLAIHANQIKLAVESVALMERAKERFERAWAYTKLLEVIEALPGTEVSEVLTTIATSALQLLGASNVVLFEYVENWDRFEKPVMVGYFKGRAQVETSSVDEDVMRWALHSGPHFVQHVKAQEALSAARPDSKPRFVVREQIESIAALVLRSQQEAVGILFVNFKNRQAFSVADQNALLSLSASAGNVIAASRRRVREARAKQKQAEVCAAVAGAIAEANLTHFSIQSLLELILRRGLEIIPAQVPFGQVRPRCCGVIMWLERAAERLRSVAVSGFPDNLDRPITQHIAEGVVGYVARTGRAKLVKDVNLEACYKATVAETRAELAVPVLHQGSVIGVINFETDRVGAFDELDAEILEVLAQQVSLVVGCLDRVADPVSHRRVRECVERKCDGIVDLEQRLGVVLTGLTAGQGLSYSRAMLFLLDAERRRLECVMAIGALTRTEANQIWGTLTHFKPAQLGPVGGFDAAAEEVFLNQLLHKAAQRPNWGEGELLTFVRDFGPLELPSQGESAPAGIAECARTRKHQIVRPYDDGDDLVRALRSMSDHKVASDMICMPLLNERGLVGVLALDGEFLAEPDQPAIRAVIRTGSIETCIDSVKPFADLIAKILAEPTGVYLETHLGPERHARLRVGVPSELHLRVCAPISDRSHITPSFVRGDWWPDASAEYDFVVTGTRCRVNGVRTKYRLGDKASPASFTLLANEPGSVELVIVVLRDDRVLHVADLTLNVAISEAPREQRVEA